MLIPDKAHERAKQRRRHGRSLEPAVDAADNDSLILWAESPEEARTFLRRAKESCSLERIAKIFVAKRSPNSRSANYIEGQYYPTSNNDGVDVYDSVVIAPYEVTNLVQWCTCDVMLSRGCQPLLVFEDTTHIVRMNLYQRVPRLARAASLGVPGIALQGTRGLDYRLRGDRWALYRFLQFFDAASRMHASAPPLVVHYEPGGTNERQAQDFVFSHINAITANDVELVTRQRTEVLSRIANVLDKGVDGDVPPDIPSIIHSGNEVVVRIGAKPDKKSWREKGSGQMDPYIGLIVAAKYIYCYDQEGQKRKPLVVEFTYINEGFWFFKDK